MAKKKVEVINTTELDKDKYYIISVKTGAPAEQKLQIFKDMMEEIQRKGFGQNIVLIDGDTVTVPEAVEYLDTADELKFREKYERLLDAVKWRHAEYKKDLDRGCDFDGVPLKGTNLAITQNLFNVTDAILASVGEDEHGEKKIS